jgi:hypothetical protein
MVDRSIGSTPVKGYRSMRPGPALVTLLALAFLYNGYYLFGGFHGDDAIFLSLTKRDPLPYSRWLGMWAADFGAVLEGLWFFEGAGLKAFFRPLPSIIFEGSVYLLGEWAFPLHFLSILLHGLVGGAIFVLVRNLTQRPGLGLLAGAIFLSIEDHSMGIGVITMSTDSLCVLFVVIALIAHAAWLSRRRPWQLFISLIALWPAFLSKESAVLAPVGMALMSLLLPRGMDEQLAPASCVTDEVEESELEYSELAKPGTGAGRFLGSLGAFMKDWLSWAPALLMMVLYLGLYRALGFGGLSSGMYIDPFAAPARYAGHLVGHLPVMWLATLSPVPPSVAWFVPALLLPFALAGLVLFTAWMVGLWPLRRSGLVAWSIAFYLLSLLPQMASDASERALYSPAVAASILLAILAAEVPFLARRVWPDRPRAPRWTCATGWAVLFAVLVPGILLSCLYPFVWQPSFERLDRDALTAVHHIERETPAHVLLLNTPGWLHGMYMPALIEHQIGYQVDVRVLSSMNAVVSLVRLNETDLLVRADRDGWLTNPLAGMLRPPGPPERGAVFKQDLLSATLEEMTPGGGDVAAVRFHMDLAVGDPALLFLSWNGEAFSPVEVASLPQGEEIVLADTSDVWASMW